MSRLIVRGLPSYLTDARLREHFSQKGAVTDVKLMRRPDGTSRKFGFVGYRSDEEAQQALDYFNRTFIDTSRITIEPARQIGDEELAKQREERRARRNGASDEASTSTSDARKRKGDKSISKDEEPAKAKKKAKKGAVSFEEFMSVMQPKAKRKAWQNEDAIPEQTMEDIFAPVEAIEKKAARRAQKKADAEASAAAAAESAAQSKDASEESDAEPDAAANDVGLTDEEYMRLRMKHKVGTDLDTLHDPADTPQFEQSDDEKDAAAEESDPESEDEQVNDEELERKQAASRRKAEIAAEKDQKIVDQIMESGRLFIRNLPFSANQDEIQSFFESFGTVKQVHIPLDKSTKASKGLAFVSFTDPSHALAAYRAKDGSTFQGRLLHLLPAVNKDAPAEGDTKKAATLKQARAEQKKDDAAKDFNWSMLYMSSDAVASSIADRLGVSKAEILNPGAEGGPDNAAVRLALAETRIIQETKEFFAQEGINVDAFDGKKSQRSETTILVKNIPYGTSGEEVEKLFASHGEVDKVLIPPSGTIAIVEMPVVSEARVAFRALAYKKFKGGILYLEKAPVGLLAPQKAGDQVVKQAPIVGKTIDTTNPTSNIKSTGEEEAADGATLYIKNLSFSTTDERLASTFHGLSDYAFAHVQTKPDPRRPGARLSMGYGFVGFKSVDSARTAQRAMDGKVLDGHTLVVTFARRNADTPTATSLSSGGSTKILIKNLPFEATKKDIRDLFSSQGQLKSVRLPKKFDNSTRGFGFVEYTTVREAQSAMEALKHTHLLGRHLVLQWSKVGKDEGEEVEMQRNKTRKGFVGGEEEGRADKRQKIKLNSAQISEAVRKARSKRDDVEDDE
ncbi:RNA recognition motif domain protein [Kalmanozyma brasiliensis GHG001]|uniref:Multiple RNA-binding domain-containing protein 1 n=1 Tax=Kalmanozyma brasiliensis (strain GHG001) TaxID=1365824 RepID=V5EUN8_KALBG|nr:RNA recognition motif domain protein [Kalmanozyma brasiliensis GHG001]EST05859.1 RNA recognition motif domain protein [Kalmanozyma brasiliensis GHG001]